MSDPSSDEERPVKRFKHVPRWLWWAHWEWVMNAMLLLIALAIVAQTLYFRHVSDDQKDCLARQITTLTTALNARQEPADIERQATRNLLTGAIDAHGDQTKVAQLVADYEQALAKSDRLRDENPLPDYPNGACTP